PQFKFAKTEIGPIASETELPSGFSPGQPARSTLVSDAVDAALLGWREAGHAKVEVAADDVVADHRQSTLSATVRMAPGPALRFGAVTIQGEERMREQRIIKMAGLRYGEKFSQSELDRAAQRLRRSGVFRSVTLTEAD